MPNIMMKNSTLILGILITLTVVPVTAHTKHSIPIAVKNAAESSIRAGKFAGYAGSTIFFASMTALFGFTALAALPDIVKLRRTSRLKVPLHDDRIVHYPLFEMQGAFSDAFFALVTFRAALYSAKKAKEAAFNSGTESNKGSSLSQN